MRNTAYDNLYRSQNERWCSLHCFQYNAMYQTAKGYEVCEASPSQQITYWFRNGSIAICNFWNFECRYEASWSVIAATNGCCRHKLNPDGFMLYLKHDGLMVLLPTRDMNYSIKWNVESFYLLFVIRVLVRLTCCISFEIWSLEGKVQHFWFFTLFSCQDLDKKTDTTLMVSMKLMPAVG